MAETVFYMRGAFPFVSGKGVPPELVVDAKVLLELQTDQLNALAQELTSFDSFLDKPTLKKTVQSFVPSEELANRVSRLIFQIDEYLRQSKSGLEALFGRMADTIQEPEDPEKPILTPAEFDELKRRMSVIIKPYAGLHRQAKAQRLSEATGLRLEHLEIICDLRPVFDDAREHVEGVIPFTILKIVCIGADGLPIAMETILTQAEVEELTKKSQAAVKKLDRLRELLAEKDLPVPPVTMVKKGD
jgi:hypothetical protein